MEIDSEIASSNNNNSQRLAKHPVYIGVTLTCE